MRASEDTGRVFAGVAAFLSQIAQYCGFLTGAVAMPSTLHSTRLVCPSLLHIAKRNQVGRSVSCIANSKVNYDD